MEDKDTLTALAEKMLGNSKTRKGFLKLAKEVEPEMSLPELDVDAQIEAATKPLQDKIAELTKGGERAAAIERLEERRKPLRAKGMNDAEIDRIEKVALEKGIGNLETAHEFVKNMEAVAAPKSAPKVPVASTFTGVKPEFLKDPVKGARDEAALFFAERSGMPKAG